MTKTIVSFGDSFIWGTEIFNNTDGSKGWPGLIAHDLGLHYTTCAVPGCGNDHIARQVFSYFHSHSKTDTLAVINWTWGARYDFYAVASESWVTLGPTCVAQRLENWLGSNAEAQRVVEFYRDHLGNSITWDRIRSLTPMLAVQQYLESHDIPSIQTHMDLELFDTKWHCPDYVRELQNLVSPNLQSFDGMNFLDWSRSHGFEITDPGLHPLEEAHISAANFWKDRYAQTLAR